MNGLIDLPSNKSRIVDWRNFNFASSSDLTMLKTAFIPFLEISDASAGDTFVEKRPLRWLRSNWLKREKKR